MRRDEKGSIIKDIAEMPSSEGIELPPMTDMFPVSLAMLKASVLRYFPEAYMTSTDSPNGMLWAVHQSPRHHPFSVTTESELKAWEDAANWIPSC